MNYYISILYARKSEDGSSPEGFDMTFDDDLGFVGKRVTYPRYSDQISIHRMKLLSSSESFSPFRRGHRMTIDTYEVPKKEFEGMEEKPELEKYVIDGKKETYGWTEKNHQDKYSEVRRYIIKGYKPNK